MRVTVTLIALACTIAACGYKTPLVLPKPKPQTAPQQQAPADEAAQKKPAEQ